MAEQSQDNAGISLKKFSNFISQVESQNLSAQMKTSPQKHIRPSNKFIKTDQKSSFSKEFFTPKSEKTQQSFFTTSRPSKFTQNADKTFKLLPVIKLKGKGVKDHLTNEYKKIISQDPGQRYSFDFVDSSQSSRLKFPFQQEMEQQNEQEKKLVKNQQLAKLLGLNSNQSDQNPNINTENNSVDVNVDTIDNISKEDQLETADQQLQQQQEIQDLEQSQQMSTYLEQNQAYYEHIGGQCVCYTTRHQKCEFFSKQKPIYQGENMDLLYNTTHKINYQNPDKLYQKKRELFKENKNLSLKQLIAQQDDMAKSIKLLNTNQNFKNSFYNQSTSKNDFNKDAIKGGVRAASYDKVDNISFNGPSFYKQSLYKQNIVGFQPNNKQEPMQANISKLQQSSHILSDLQLEQSTTYKNNFLPHIGKGAKLVLETEKPKFGFPSLQPFVTESVSKQDFQNPNNHKSQLEKIISNKLSESQQIANSQQSSQLLMSQHYPSHPGQFITTSKKDFDEKTLF